MADGREKKSLWGIFRTHSVARKVAKLAKQQPRRASDGDGGLRRGRDEVDGERDSPRPQRRGERAEPAITKGKGKDPEDPSIRLRDDTAPLTEWPPSGMSSGEELTLKHATELISKGAPAHNGHKRSIPHAADHYYALYMTSDGTKGDASDRASPRTTMTELMSMRIQGPGVPRYPWETLEQPSCSFYFGALPGTVTLNYWTSLSSNLPLTIPLRDPGVEPREVNLVQIFERLQDLERAPDDDNEEYLYRNLYKRFLRDPDKPFKPHKALEKQITDLILVLSRSDWIDFSNPKNQIATRFIFDTGHANHDTYVKFFHQLVLSLELDLRIHSRAHSDRAKARLLFQIPPTIQWSLALARRWRENVRVEGYGRTADQVKLRFKLKKRQVRQLKRFAQTMKWPNLAATLEKLKQRDADAGLDAISSDAMAFFSGLVLPGPSYPFLLMNTLIDIDPDKATDELALLTPTYPQCGFQYRNSYTYWSAACIVGKVLAPTCHLFGGWVGPGRPTADLARCQIARIRARRPRLIPDAEDIVSTNERSDPLGPPTEIFPVKEYKLVFPDADDIVDTVRIELLNFKPAAGRANDSGPKWFDATVQFAIDGISWPLHLMYDVSFISAWPCSEGPHPLFFDYIFETTRVDEIINIKNWGQLYGVAPSGASSPLEGASSKAAVKKDLDEEEKVLVVEAFGVRDNEVLARAWCSHWGLSAVVAHIRQTCTACAIREAYAATINVVILIDDQQQDEDD